MEVEEAHLQPGSPATAATALHCTGYPMAQPQGLMNPSAVTCCGGLTVRSAYLSVMLDGMGIGTLDLLRQVAATTLLVFRGDRAAAHEA